LLFLEAMSGEAETATRRERFHGTTTLESMAVLPLYRSLEDVGPNPLGRYSWFSLVVERVSGSHHNAGGGADAELPCKHPLKQIQLVEGVSDQKLP
jgi:hypothetical protein